MASFYAELQVAGHTYPVRRCSYEFTQATDARGRVNAKVRHGLVQLLLDVPDDDFLLDWANTPYKPLPGCVVFYETKGSAARETLSWEAGNCVGYREDFQSGSIEDGAYVCHVTITAPKLTMQAGGPGGYLPPVAGTHGSPQQGLLNNPFVLTPPVGPTVSPPAVPPSPVLARIAAALLRVLTSAPAMTAALVFMSNNSRDDPGYKSEWDFGRLSQVPTDQDRARLAYLEAEREHRALTDEEQDELVSLLAIVRKVHLGSPTSLVAYYGQRAADAREARAVDATRGGHSYAEHGAHVTPAQHETRLRTGRKPSGVTPVKPDGTPDIPTKSASFESDAKHLETLRLADQQLQTEKINSKGGLKKKVDFNVQGTTRTGKAYELDASGNVKVTQVDGARAAYRLNPATGAYELITLFPK